MSTHYNFKTRHLWLYWNLACIAVWKASGSRNNRWPGWLDLERQPLRFQRRDSNRKQTTVF